MDGFFITVNCSGILSDSSETSYKIFIDNTKMSIVYELKEWIRFMFNLENCFFLIHDNSVIHELEDIKVLEILKHLQTRPCVQYNCIHSRIEKNLLNKLNLFTYWNEVKVHKLFLARQNNLIRKYCSNTDEKLNTFSSESHHNTCVQLDNSQLANTEHVISSPSECTYNIKMTTESNKENSTEKNQMVFEEINTPVNDKDFNLGEIRTSSNFFNHKKSSSPHSKSNDNVSLCTGTVDLTSSESKKQKGQSQMYYTTRKTPRSEIPFCLGALLSDIREKAQNDELKQKQDTNKTEASFCPYGEKDKSPSLKMDFVDNINDLGKRKKRRRRHKKENMKVDINPPFPDKSWNYEEPSFNTRPNHIRFGDSDEIMETEATDTLDNGSNDCNSFKILNNETQMTVAPLVPGPTPVVEENEDKKDCSLRIRDQDKALQMFLELNSSRETDVAVEKKEVDSFLQNPSPLESLKQRIKANGVISKFY